MKLLSKTLTLLFFHFANFTLPIYAQFSPIDQSELKIYTDHDYLNFQIDDEEQCLTKDEIIERQIVLEFKKHQANNDFGNEEEHLYVKQTLAELRKISILWDCQFKKFHVSNNSDKS